MIHWDIIRNLIISYKPKLFFNAIGVDIKDIKDCEKKLDIKFPLGYKDYLLDVGMQFNLNILGAPHGAFVDFTSLIKYLPAKNYLQKSMFKIIEPSKASVGRETLFLDIPKSNGYDVPLVEYDDSCPYFDSDAIDPYPLSFMEHLTSYTISNLFHMKWELVHIPINTIIEKSLKKGFIKILDSQENLYFMESSQGVILLEKNKFNGVTLNYEQSIDKAIVDFLITY